MQIKEIVLEIIIAIVVFWIIVSAIFFNIDLRISTYGLNIIQSFGTFATLIAGYLAFKASLKHADVSSNLEKESKRNKLSASKAFLSLSLSKFCSYSDECMNYVILDKEAPEPKEIEKDFLLYVKETIELSEGEEQKRLAYLINSYQVQLSRFKRYKNYSVEDNRWKREEFDHLIDAALLKYISSSIFNWSRNE